MLDVPLWMIREHTQGKKLRIIFNLVVAAVVVVGAVIVVDLGSGDKRFGEGRRGAEVQILHWESRSEGGGQVGKSFITKRKVRKQKLLRRYTSHVMIRYAIDIDIDIDIY